MNKEEKQEFAHKLHEEMNDLFNSYRDDFEDKSDLLEIILNLLPSMICSFVKTNIRDEVQALTMVHIIGDLVYKYDELKNIGETLQ
jgi:predicted house-cleaning noncanonical NTP pyrophosphatase (MazG superfamily)